MGIKIIIVGGSVAGLSLANMLERFDIDYTILEAYSEIAPQVGASIGLLPNGLRILDQGDLPRCEWKTHLLNSRTYHVRKNGETVS
ncbi:hypothetical protein CaCOL14_012234 [Colletotrichum acutatum]